MGPAEPTWQVHSPGLGRPAEILLVVDSAVDQAMTIEAFRLGRIINTLHCVGSGEDALGFLHQRGAYAEAPRPDLILLDLVLPDMPGRDVLREVKADDDLKAIPILVLTSAVTDAVLRDLYDLHANAYVIKPINLDEFIAAIRAIQDFYFEVVRLPK